MTSQHDLIANMSFIVRPVVADWIDFTPGEWKLKWNQSSNGGWAIDVEPWNKAHVCDCWRIPWRWHHFREKNCGYLNQRRKMSWFRCICFSADVAMTIVALIQNMKYSVRRSSKMLRRCINSWRLLKTFYSFDRDRQKKISQKYPLTQNEIIFCRSFSVWQKKNPFDYISSRLGSGSVRCQRY